MTETANVIVAALMLLFASMYLGTGWSLVLFSFPIEPKLTPRTYELPFIEPVKHATDFFTYMTIAMIVASVALIVGEADSEYLWAPIAYLAGVIAATVLTLLFIFPYNKELKAGVEDEERLHVLLGKWMRLNVIRTSLWTVQWIAIALYFVLKAA
ncbi:MAG TPA: anthrone oxygenase family protein [Solirubrobacterales bacterium]|nr:anthrone oxygenase family protein [Solirubrobacterales bacterium]